MTVSLPGSSVVTAKRARGELAWRAAVLEDTPTIAVRCRGGLGLAPYRDICRGNSLIRVLINTCVMV